MRILVIVQDLRISGTSEGVVSRSFLGKLRKSYPSSHIDVVYLKNHQNEDRLDELPVDTIREHYIRYHIPNYIIWLNKIYWRISSSNLKDKFHIAKYRSVIKKLDFKSYDYVFVRSSGQGYENILALGGLSILQKAIINFHDPFPVLWDTGTKYNINRIEVNKLRTMWPIVQQAGACISPAHVLSEDMQHLYGSNKKFFTIPHQYDEDVFPTVELGEIRKREKQVTISYHGAVQLGRNLDILLDAYLDLLNSNADYGEKTEFVLRIRGNHTMRLKQKYVHPNVVFLETLDFCSSAEEQKQQADIVIVLENCAAHSNILVGKAPFLASLNKPVLSLSPLRSEMRKIIKSSKYIAECNNQQEIGEKLKVLISDCFDNNKSASPFGDYFSDQNFESHLNPVLECVKLNKPKT